MLIWVFWATMLINLTSQIDWARSAQIFDKTFLEFLWGCFWMLIFKSVDWVKQIALLEVGGPHPISQSLKRNLTLPWVRGYFSYLAAFKMEHSLFPTFALELKTNFSWVLSLMAFELELYHQLSWVSSLQTHCRSWGLSASIITWPESLQ